MCAFICVNVCWSKSLLISKLLATNIEGSLVVVTGASRYTIYYLTNTVNKQNVGVQLSIFNSKFSGIGEATARAFAAEGATGTSW